MLHSKRSNLQATLFSLNPLFYQNIFYTSQQAMPIPSTLPVVCDESVMSQKQHGTSETPGTAISTLMSCAVPSIPISHTVPHSSCKIVVQKNLRWGCDFETADRICNFNRHYAGECVSYLVLQGLLVVPRCLRPCPTQH